MRISKLIIYIRTLRCEIAYDKFCALYQVNYFSNDKSRANIFINPLCPKSDIIARSLYCRIYIIHFMSAEWHNDKYEVRFKISLVIRVIISASKFTIYKRMIATHIYFPYTHNVIASNMTTMALIF